jgi:hypothetical protein
MQTMGTEAPTTLVIPVHCAPKKAPCPKCGIRGRRKRTVDRTVRTVAYKAVALLEITYGEYEARCACCTTFRNTPEGVRPKAHYDNKVRDLVLERLLKDGMSIERALESIRREFLLELSSGFVYDVLRDQAAELDMAAHRRKVLEHFSGTLCVDELHLGRFTLLLATDPLADLPVAFALVGANDQGHMQRFLKNLKTWGQEFHGGGNWFAPNLLRKRECGPQVVTPFPRGLDFPSPARTGRLSGCCRRRLPGTQPCCSSLSSSVSPVAPRCRS